MYSLSKWAINCCAFSMGLIVFFFDYEKWYELYAKNCSLHTLEYWNNQTTANIPIGAFYFSIGTICMFLYIPFMLAMSKPEFIQHSCYKFMFLLSIIDMIAIPCDAIISGWQCMLGINYCTNPVFFYMVGVGSISAYLGSTITCVLLALDRFFQMLFPKVSKILFGPKMMYFWLIVPLLYMIHSLFEIPAFFSNFKQAFYYDPYFYGKNLTFLVANSALAIVGMGVPYATICIVISCKMKVYHTSSVSRLQKVMLLQSMAICFEMFFVAVVYVGNQFISGYPEFLTKIEHTIWICAHGDTPIVYLLLNASLRKKFFQMIKEYTAKKKPRTIAFATSVIHIRVSPHTLST